MSRVFEVGLVEARLRAELAACKNQVQGLTSIEMLEALAGVMGSLTGATDDTLLQMRYLERMREARGK